MQALKLLLSINIRKGLISYCLSLVFQPENTHSSFALSFVKWICTIFYFLILIFPPWNVHICPHDLCISKSALLIMVGATMRQGEAVLLGGHCRGGQLSPLSGIALSKWGQSVVNEVQWRIGKAKNLKCKHLVVSEVAEAERKRHLRVVMDSLMNMLTQSVVVLKKRQAAC